MVQTSILDVKLKSPLILASGILGVTGSSMVNVHNNGAGAVITKSIGLEPRKGHPNPTILVYGEGMINAVGLSNAGVKDSIPEIEYAKKAGVVVIASIFGGSVQDYGKVAKEISKAKPNLLEVNISCPNVEDEFGKPFSCDPDLASKVVKEVKKNTKIPIIVKLSPNVSDIKAIAQAVEKAGADAISAINTVGPGMVINIEAGKPVLSNKVGGLSGPAIKPIAVKCIYDIYQAVKIPVIGCGGVTTGRDAIELMMAGAQAVELGSAVYYRGVEVFDKIKKEIDEWMKKEGYKDLKEIVGKAHEK